MQIRRTWTTKHWCESVIQPEWPFAYSKYYGQIEEIKGRVSTNKQDVRHKCETRGVRSKCHICENIVCGESLHSNITRDKQNEASCHMQLQGVHWSEISNNIPTVSDVPWAVGGKHRYDFGGDKTTHVCMYMSGMYPCQSSFGQDYSSCSMRCWGHLNALSGINNSAVYSSSGNGSITNVWPNLHSAQTMGVKAAPWLLRAPTESWSYPKTDANAVPRNPLKKNFNIVPQGFTFTLAGSSNGHEGFVDGLDSEARFFHPEDIAVDDERYVYVADTGNHAIRMISPSGTVKTIAGTGQKGTKVGPVTDGAQFDSPSAISVWRDWEWWPYPDPDDPDSVLYRNGNGTLVLFVADTANHRIQKITGMVQYNGSGEKNWKDVVVECFSGSCADNNHDPGYADGSSEEARFDSPRGIVVSSDGSVFVADSNNHLIRTIDRWGKTRTIHGILSNTQVPHQGILRPCTSLFDHNNSNLACSKFFFPSGIALGVDEKSLLVTDRHRLYQIDIIQGTTTILAGTESEGDSDGKGSESSFNRPNAVTVTSDGTAYIADSISCRIRRVFPSSLAVPNISCSDTLATIFRPSGCSSYNSGINKHGITATDISGNINYNYRYRNNSHIELGKHFIGKGIKDCIGSPPTVKLDKKLWSNTTKIYPYNLNLVIDDLNHYAREDPNDGTIIRVSCPINCRSNKFIRGLHLNIVKKELLDSSHYLFSEDSPVCIAANFTGVINMNEGGFVDIMLHQLHQPTNYTAFRYSTETGESHESNSNWIFRQLYSVYSSAHEMIVQTISGAPSTLLENSCGYKDAIPPQSAKYGTPAGISSFVNRSLDDKNNFLYIADRNNNVIRAISATCSYPCENGGRCIGPDVCSCKLGWGGDDCTRPKCSVACGIRQLCVAPNSCQCIPGYFGSKCLNPVCVQECQNDGYCSAPDTCSCRHGWFDSNCSTPVCEQTCGNGGNCSSANTCSCPEEWNGVDCRIPVCKQKCLNGGICVAPSTCACPPQFSSFDCGEPICHQGFFSPSSRGKKVTTISNWLEYRPCDVMEWCRITSSFDCAQEHLDFSSVLPKYGAEWRHRTGRRKQSSSCSTIELRSDALSMFQYINSWDNTSTPLQLHSPQTPFGWNSSVRILANAWLKPHSNFTQPWIYQLDRQLALVELYNVTQGAYVCANSGSCVAPDTCACADGWIGFDCRVPVCEQGYYEQNQEIFVKGSDNEKELEQFERFLDTNQIHLDPVTGYSNPSYNLAFERYINRSHVEKMNVKIDGKRYLKNDGKFQGGYSCSIRSVTEWEDYRSGYLFEHPNYFSKYMDKQLEGNKNISTHWSGMGWQQTYRKSKPLQLDNMNNNYGVESEVMFTYTDQGYRLNGEWTKTGAVWTKGSCIIEFKRVCEDKSKLTNFEVLINKGLRLSNIEIIVQDTDKVRIFEKNICIQMYYLFLALMIFFCGAIQLCYINTKSFRPRANYTEAKAIILGQWKIKGGECVDHVLRGCFNNGTCVAPNKCACKDGWNGYDCAIPKCHQSCFHNGNCTHPDICTCEKGWTGYDCSVPICVQDCNNRGICVAPDTCKCHQWENTWRDGRTNGGVPLFQKPNGDQQLTGWTGYDCATPICVQAEMFRLNIDTKANNWNDLVSLGGHGKDGTLECNTMRCPQYEKMVTMNDGRSFQTGCGFDPLDTGCCYKDNLNKNKSSSNYRCVKCSKSTIDIQSHLITCDIDKIESQYFENLWDIPFPLCGIKHNPGGSISENLVLIDLNLYPEYSEVQQQNSTKISDSFLCGRHEWEQGDFIDSAGLDNEVGIGANFGLSIGRHIRINYNNYQQDSKNKYIWRSGEKNIPGEGIFQCYNHGSCIAPDVCSCRDGYSGFDCNTPLCRHKQTNGFIVGCLNGGICQSKDNCNCMSTISVLWTVQTKSKKALTGWTGTDCSIPICVQGYYDPHCKGLSAMGGEGCYRCANNGICIAPDTCRCGEGWSGFDCRNPVCTAKVTPFVRKQLMTVDKRKIEIFENDPCSMVGFYKPEVLGGVAYYRGNCTLPNQCTCLCKGVYSSSLCNEVGGIFCVKPFDDPLKFFRNLLAPNKLFGSRQCHSGYEGLLDESGRFISCHMEIYEPSYFVRHTLGFILSFVIISLSIACYFIYSRSKIGEHYALKHMRQRKSKKEPITSPRTSSFLYPVSDYGEDGKFHRD